MVNANVKHNPNPNPNHNPYLNLYPTLNRKPIHHPHFNSLAAVGDIITTGAVIWRRSKIMSDQLNVSCIMASFIVCLSPYDVLG